MSKSGKGGPTGPNNGSSTYSEDREGKVEIVAVSQRSNDNAEVGEEAHKKRLSVPSSEEVAMNAATTSEEDIRLWEEELMVRKDVANSPISGNFVGAFVVNTYSALYILVAYLISLESLLSIALSVGMTVCKYPRTVGWKEEIYSECPPHKQKQPIHGLNQKLPYFPLASRMMLY